jgi:hypothetical protein
MLAHEGSAGVAMQIVTLAPRISSDDVATLMGVPTEPNVPVAPSKLMTGADGLTVSDTVAFAELVPLDAVIK